MKLRPPLWALPRRLRQRYAAEIVELFGQSKRQLFDWLDVLRLGLRARLEDIMRSIAARACALTAAVSLVAFGYAIAELTDGVRDIHEHWWSSAPLLTLVASAIGWDIARRSVASVSPEP